jgi:hypothetical protein
LFHGFAIQYAGDIMGDGGTDLAFAAWDEIAEQHE